MEIKYHRVERLTMIKIWKIGDDRLWIVEPDKLPRHCNHPLASFSTADLWRNWHDTPFIHERACRPQKEIGKKMNPK